MRSCAVWDPAFSPAVHGYLCFADAASQDVLFVSVHNPKQPKLVRTLTGQALRAALGLSATTTFRPLACERNGDDSILILCRVASGELTSNPSAAAPALPRMALAVARKTLELEPSDAVTQFCRGIGAFDARLKADSLVCSTPAHWSPRALLIACCYRPVTAKTTGAGAVDSKNVLYVLHSFQWPTGALLGSVTLPRGIGTRFAASLHFAPLRSFFLLPAICRRRFFRRGDVW